MKPLAASAALVWVLSASTVLAQTPGQAQPAGAGVGVKIAFFDPEIAFQQCAEGKANLARLTALTQRKQAENGEKLKQLQTNQQKLQAGSNVLTNEARAQIEKEIERQQVDLQRFQQDAQAEINGLQQDVQSEFGKHLRLVVGDVAKENGIQILFNAAEPAVAWISPTLDVTPDVVKKLDATSKPALPHD